MSEMYEEDPAYQEDNSMGVEEEGGEFSRQAAHPIGDLEVSVFLPFLG